MLSVLYRIHEGTETVYEATQVFKIPEGLDEYPEPGPGIEVQKPDGERFHYPFIGQWATLYVMNSEGNTIATYNLGGAHPAVNQEAT